MEIKKDKVDTKEKNILVMAGYEVVMTGQIFMNREREHSRMWHIEGVEYHFINEY